MWLGYSIDGFVVMTSIMVVVAVSSIALRFWSRAVVMGGQYGWDDWLALAALLPTLVLLASMLWVARYGIEIHNNEPSTSQPFRVALMVWIASYGFNISVGVSKLSMVAFYARIFGPWKLSGWTWKLTIGFVALFTAAWTVGETLYNTFRCDPILKAVKPEMVGHCASLGDSLVSSAATNVANDIMVVLLPVPQLLKLRMDWGKKFLVAVTLFLGYSIAFLSVGRLIVVIKALHWVDKEPFYFVIAIFYWIVAETALSLLGISLPSIYQLIQRGWQFGLGSLFRSCDISELQSANPPKCPCSHPSLARLTSENATSGLLVRHSGMFARTESSTSDDLSSLAPHSPGKPEYLDPV